MGGYLAEAGEAAIGSVVLGVVGERTAHGFTWQRLGFPIANS
jgi:hypothetical protein